LIDPLGILIVGSGASGFRWDIEQLTVALVISIFRRASGEMD
jgi:hypothetical protein